MRVMSETSGRLAVRDRAWSIGRMLLATLLHGLGSGAVGIFIAHLIRTVQILGPLETLARARRFRSVSDSSFDGLFHVVSIAFDGFS